jgi:hypothetical protein
MTLRDKIEIGILSILFGVWAAFIYVNPNFSMRMDLSVFSINTHSITESQHTVAYGVDAKHTEKMYTAVRAYLGVLYVNDKVKIYLAQPKYSNGAIGQLSNGLLFIGIYRQSATFRKDVIVYNGEDLVLIHELAHFFDAHMKSNDRAEDFAYLVERSMTIYKLDEAMRDK